MPENDEPASLQSTGSHLLGGFAKPGPPGAIPGLPSVSRGIAGARASYVTATLIREGIAIPQVSTRLAPIDHLDRIRSRLVARRERIRVTPGLYAVGKPAAEDTVFVTANYKPSFDALRSSLANRTAWILVLDTKGVNVWCAAGKGTFGDAELLARIRESRLAKIAPGTTLVLPQLGMVGVSGFDIARATGFKVLVGPIRARDLGRFLDDGYRATPSMRTVDFGIKARLELVPRELMAYSRSFIVAFAALLGCSLGRDYFLLGSSLDISRATQNALTWFLAPGLGALWAIIGLPILLPWLPFRRFSAKGAFLGLLSGMGWALAAHTDPVVSVAGIAASVAAGTFLGLMFTGSSTFTSLAAVRTETAIAMPVVHILAGLAIVTFGFSIILSLAGAIR